MPSNLQGMPAVLHWALSEMRLLYRVQSLAGNCTLPVAGAEVVN